MRRTLLLLALPLALASCDLVGSDDFALPGTYLLVSIDEASLPARVVDDPDRTVDVWGLTLRLASDGTYRSRLELRIAEGETHTVRTVRLRGDFRREGANLLLDGPTVEGERAILEILDGHSLREITELRKVLRYERVTSRN